MLREAFLREPPEQQALAGLDDTGEQESQTMSTTTTGQPMRTPSGLLRSVGGRLGAVLMGLGSILGIGIFGLQRTDTAMRCKRRPRWYAHGLMRSTLRRTRQERRSWRIATLALAWLGACSGGDRDGEAAADAGTATVDISGRYDNVEMLSGPCGAPSPDALAPPTILVDSLQSTYYVRSCQTLDDSECPSIYYDFTVPIENGWAAEGGSAFFSAQCTLSWERSTATLLNETLTVHTLRYEIVSEVPEQECTLEAAAALEAPCAHETILTATRIASP